MIMNFDLFPQSKIIQSDQLKRNIQHMSKIHLVHFVHFRQFYNQNDLTDLNSENRCIINNHMIKNRLNFEILKIRQEKKIEHWNKILKKMGTFLIQF